MKKIIRWIEFKCFCFKGTFLGESKRRFRIQQQAYFDAQTWYFKDWINGGWNSTTVIHRTMRHDGP